MKGSNNKGERRLDVILAAPFVAFTTLKLRISLLELVDKGFLWCDELDLTWLFLIVFSSLFFDVFKACSRI